MNESLKGYYCAMAEDVVMYLGIIAFCIVAMTCCVLISAIMNFQAKKSQIFYWNKRAKDERN